MNNPARSLLFANLLAVAAVVVMAGGVLAKGEDVAGSVILAQPIPRDDAVQGKRAVGADASPASSAAAVLAQLRRGEAGRR